MKLVSMYLMTVLNFIVQKYRTYCAHDWYQIESKFVTDLFPKSDEVEALRAAFDIGIHSARVRVCLKCKRVDDNTEWVIERITREMARKRSRRQLAHSIYDASD